MIFKHMEPRCRCNGDCIKETSHILNELESFYAPCKDCVNLKLKKFKPLKEQLKQVPINSEWGLCSCNRRHLDTVIAHILVIMQECGLKDEQATLRKTCTPLITPGLPLHESPYLPKDSLIILSPDLNRNSALRIFKEVPEVKGVIKGEMDKKVGVLESESASHTYKLLAGCDMRSDLVQTPSGPIIIYKNQSEIHIELPRTSQPKINAVNLAIKKLTNNNKHPKVLDCTCGPGTLGIAALKGSASRVVFNDIWYPAVYTTALNLEVNGFPVELFDRREGLVASGKEWDVYCLDIKELKNFLDEKFDLCIIDTFPGVNPESFKKAVNRFCQETLVI